MESGRSLYDICEYIEGGLATVNWQHGFKTVFVCEEVQNLF